MQSTINGTTTTFVGGHFEVTGTQVTKYYFAGASRVAMRKYTIPQPMTVEYLLGDHLGSTGITTDTSGAKVSEIRYKPWGEIRYSWTSGTATTPAYKLPNYTFTGQYSYMDDPTTSGVTEGFGLMFYNARWYDPALGRFNQPDTVIPEQSQGTQAWDHYAYVSNNPVRYNDPTGHVECGIEEPCMGGGGLSGYGGSAGGEEFYDAEKNFEEWASKQQSESASLEEPAVQTTLEEAAEITDPYADIKALEETDLTEFNPHTLDHAPEAADTDLLNRSLSMEDTAITKFSSTEEMVDSIMQTIDDHIDDINQMAEYASKNSTDSFLGEDVAFSGFRNGTAISGRAPVNVVIKFDGDGGWFLLTAYPKP